MKKSSRRPQRSEIEQDLDYRTAPTNPDPVLLENWVAGYRAGMTAYRQLIISAHLHLTASIAVALARRYNRLHMVDELVAEANLHLVQAVEDAPSALSDNNITPYISTTVRHRLHDFISEDRIVFMPGRTFRHKAAHGELEADNLEVRTIAVFSMAGGIAQDNDREWDSVNELRSVSSGPNYHVPEAPPPDTSIEFEEAMSLAIQTDQERRVIDLRIEGYKYRDMETVLGLKRSRCSEIVNGVKARFFENYA